MKKFTQAQKNLYVAVAAGFGCVLGMPSIANAAPAAGNPLPFGNADSLGGNSSIGTNVSIVGGTNTNIRSRDNTVINVDSNSDGNGYLMVYDNGGGANAGQWDFDAETGFRSRPSLNAGASVMEHTAANGLSIAGTGSAGNITAEGRVQGGTLNVTGASTTNGITNTGDISTTTLNVGTDATINRDATVRRNLQVDGNSTTNGDTRTLGNTRTATLNVDTDATVGQDLRVNRNARIDGDTRTATLNVDTDATVGQDLRVNRNARIDGNTRTATLNVDTDATVGQDLRVNRDTRIDRNLRVDGVANLNGGLNVGAGTSVNMGGNRVQNVADGVADFDAVNFRQLNNLDKKLTGKIDETGAVAAAFAQLGQSQTPGKSTFGIAAGGQGSKAGVALGFSHRPIPRTPTALPVVIKVSLGASGKTVAGGVGATWEF